MRALRAIILLFALIGAVVCPAQVECLDQPVRAITSPVFHKAELSRLQKALGLAVGHTLELHRLDEAIRAVFSQGRLQTIFIDAECEGGELQLSLRGAKVRRLRKLTFPGVDPAVADEVRRKSNLEEGRSTDLRSFASVRERLKNAYEARGFYGAEVDVRIEELEETNEADIEIRVTPGDPTTVNKLVVSGGTGDENERMRELISLRKGDVFSRLVLEDGVERIKDFLRSNLYSTSRVEDVGVTFSEDRRRVDIQVLVKMGERFQYLFTGNRVFDEWELRQLLTNEVLARSDATSRIVELIEEKYRAAGFHFIRVRPNVSTDAAHRLNVVELDINEGPRVRIDQVAFSSSSELSPRELEGIFFDGAPGVLGRYLYWEAGFKEGIANFLKKVQSMGFLSARISEPKPLFSEDHRTVDLFFDLDLGTRTYITAVEFGGAKHISRDRLQNLLQFQVGQPLNRATIAESRRRILDLYSSEGFVDAKFADVDSDGISISRDGKVAVVRMPIDEGAQYTVGKVNIDGIKKTRPVVLMREMRLKTGDKYDPAKLRRSEEEIAATGLFSRVEVVAGESPEDPHVKDLKVVVREVEPGVGEVGLGGRYDPQRLRIRSFAGLAYRNLFGLNQTLSARSQISLPFSDTDFIPFVEYTNSLTYRAPYPFELPFTYTGQIGLDRFETSIVTRAILTRARVENKIDKRFTPWFTGIFRVHRFERNYTHYTPVPGKPPVDVFESIGSTGPGAIFDFRNDTFNPTKGTFHQIDVEFAHPALLSQQGIAFVLALSRNSIYIPVFSPFSLTVFLGLGYATALDDSSRLPQARLLNELALGGQSSIRGIPFHSITANSISGNKWVGMYNGRAELGVALSGSLGVATFFDSGRLMTNAGNLDGQGFGVGLRYKTPVGPAVIDVAQGLGNFRAQAVQFYFTVGTL